MTGSENIETKLPDKKTYVIRSYLSEGGGFQLWPDDFSMDRLEELGGVDLLQVFRLLHVPYKKRNAELRLQMLGMIYEQKQGDYVTYGAAITPKTEEQAFVVSTSLDLRELEALRNSVSKNDKPKTYDVGSKSLVELAEDMSIASKLPYTSWARGRVFRSDEEAKADDEHSLHYFALKKMVKDFMKMEVGALDDVSYSSSDEPSYLLDRDHLASIFPDGAIAEVYDVMSKVKNPITKEFEYAYCVEIYDRRNDNSVTLIKRLLTYDPYEISAAFAINDLLRNQTKVYNSGVTKES